MKKFLLSLFALCALSASAQRILIGDMNGDGVLSIADVTLLTSTILGERDAKYHVCVTEQHEYVDLGLPSGTLWATCNVGASAPEEYGDYFAWGEVDPKSTYNWKTYFDSIGGSSSDFRKYYNGGGKTELDLQDDAAYMNWGEGWRMPSLEQFEELCNSDYTTTSWTTQNGTDGLLITSKSNEVSLFLPAAGDHWETSYANYTFYGMYWSRTLLMYLPTYSPFLTFSSEDITLNESDCRCYGNSVRPVRVSTEVPSSPISVTSITLDSSSLTLETGDTHTLSTVVAPEDATDKSVTWTSSDSNVATVSNEGVVIAVNAGTATITATANDGSGVKAECLVEVTMIHNGHEYVDLGLPSGTLWATCNVDVNRPEYPGRYFAWGETQRKSTYWWDTYLDRIDGSGYFTKYYDNGGMTELEPEDDVAYVSWGEGWRMPSNEQLVELRICCTWTWEEKNGRYGYEVKSKTNDNSLFLPAAGYVNTGSSEGDGSIGRYWSRSLVSNYSNFATCLYFDSDNIENSSFLRCFGLSVRPVRESEDALLPSTSVETITLASSSLTLELGDTYTLFAVVTPLNAPDRSITWTSSDSNVASVSDEGVVTAVNAGTATITVTANDGSGVKAECVIIVEKPHEYVDLGLPSGTLWATTNVGADNPEEYGDYFAWGETATKSTYYWTTFKWCDHNGGYNQDQYRMTKYCRNLDFTTQEWIDTKTELDPEDDAATVNWGSEWCMPNKEQFVELLNNCDWTWTPQGGKNGYLVTSKTNSNSIFLPAAGFKDGASAYYSNSYYWSRTANSGNTSVSILMYSTKADWNGNERRYGYPIRPVRVSASE